MSESIPSCVWNLGTFICFLNLMAILFSGTFIISYKPLGFPDHCTPNTNIIRWSATSWLNGSSPMSFISCSVLALFLSLIQSSPKSWSDVASPASPSSWAYNAYWSFLCTPDVRTLWHIEPYQISFLKVPGLQLMSSNSLLKSISIFFLSTKFSSSVKSSNHNFLGLWLNWNQSSSNTVWLFSWPI